MKERRGREGEERGECEGERKKRLLTIYLFSSAIETPQSGACLETE